MRERGAHGAVRASGTRVPAPARRASEARRSCCLGGRGRGPAVPVGLPSYRQPGVRGGARRRRRVAESSRCAGGRPKAGRYRLTCSVSPVPRLGSGGIGQVRRCRQLLCRERIFACLAPEGRRTVPPFARARGFLAVHRACEEVGSCRGNRAHWRARPCTAAVPEGTASHAAVGVRRRGQQPQQAWRFLPGSWRVASAPEGVACSVAARRCPEGPVAAGVRRRRAVALEAGFRRVGICLPARHRRRPGWAPVASCRFADAGSYHGRSLLVAGRAPGCRRPVRPSACGRRA